MNTKVAMISVALLALLLPATSAISGEPKILPALPSAELRLPSIPALSTMPWLGGWQNVCTPTRVWHQDYLAVQGTLAGAPDRKDGAS